MRVCVCATRVPFASGGAEIHVDCLVEQLRARGFDTERVELPFSWHSREALLRSALAWRMLELTAWDGEPVDLVIATRFPSYLIRHPNKVVWLIHQFRQAYDLLGTRHSMFTPSDEDRRVLEMIRSMDGRGLGEARALYANAGNTAARLERFNSLRAEALYPPPKLFDRLHEGPFEGNVFSVGRLDPLKRVDLLIRALAHAPREVGARIAGEGPDRQRLEQLAAKVGVEDRVVWLGVIDDDRLVEEMSRAQAVFYAPYDEDFGYVTVEAFRAGKPLLTAHDSGGVLEFAQDGANSFVVSPRDPAALGRAIAALHRDPELARTMGENGRTAVAHLSWDHVIRKLTGRTAVE